MRDGIGWFIGMIRGLPDDESNEESQRLSRGLPIRLPSLAFSGTALLTNVTDTQNSSFDEKDVDKKGDSDPNQDPLRLSRKWDKVRPRTKSLALRGEIRRLLRMKFRYDEVMEQLQLPRSTFFRHLAAIRAEDREWLEEMARNDFLSSYRMSIELMEDQIKELVKIREEATKAHDKVKATEAICEIEVGIMDLLAYGPMVVKVDSLTHQPGVTVQPDGNSLSSFLQGRK